jgi:hypothetical protein
VKKLALGLGVLFGTADLIIAGAVIWLFVMLHQFGQESSNYVDRVLPEIISGWEETNLLRFAPDIFKYNVRPHEIFEDEFGRYRSLGPLLSCEKANGAVRFFHQSRKPDEISGNYTARAKFEGGSVLIAVRVIKKERAWQISNMWIYPGR